jgi:hypothetical protein
MGSFAASIIHGGSLKNMQVCTLYVLKKCLVLVGDQAKRLSVIRTNLVQASHTSKQSVTLMARIIQIK